MSELALFDHHRLLILNVFKGCLLSHLRNGVYQKRWQIVNSENWQNRDFLFGKAKNGHREKRSLQKTNFANLTRQSR